MTCASVPIPTGPGDGAPASVGEVVGNTGTLRIGRMLFGRLGSEFLPEMEDGQVTIKLKLPTGASVEETAQMAERVRSPFFITREYPSTSRNSNKTVNFDAEDGTVLLTQERTA